MADSGIDEDAKLIFMGGSSDKISTIKTKKKGFAWPYIIGFISGILVAYILTVLVGYIINKTSSDSSILRTAYYGYLIGCQGA